MIRDILIEVSPGETRIALVDNNGQLFKFLVQRVSQPQLVDGIFKGRVVRLEKALDAAFVDIGAKNNVFLNRPKGLHEGQEVVVQVYREASAGKLASVRRDLAISGTYLIFRPGSKEIRWPHSLKAVRRREHLEFILSNNQLEGEGWSVREAALSAKDDLILSEMLSLRALWQEVIESSIGKTGALLKAPSQVERVLRDYGTMASKVLVDDRNLFTVFNKSTVWLRREIVSKILFYDSEEAIFDYFDVCDEIDNLSERVLILPKGGRITLDFTEAMTVIDVDLGGASDHSQSSDAIFVTNMIAASEAARQIQLRNIAGLIVIDFINMRRRDQRRKIVDELKRVFKNSSTPVDVLGMTSAGLVEVTRRRDGPALNEILFCKRDRWMHPSTESLVCSALREALSMRSSGYCKLIVSPKLADLLRGKYCFVFEETNRRLGGVLLMTEDPLETEFRFEIVNRKKK